MYVCNVCLANGAEILQSQDAIKKNFNGANLIFIL